MKIFECRNTKCRCKCQLKIAKDRKAPNICLYTGYNTHWAERFKETLQDKQPATDCNQLPDRYKVGELVAYYTGKGYKYFKIAKIELNRLYSEDGKFSLMCDVGKARLRPYKADEMKALVGKVIEDKDGDCYLIYKYDATENTVETSSFIVDAEALLRDCSVDGKNAGVLEHLNENGEWVE